MDHILSAISMLYGKQRECYAFFRDLQADLLSGFETYEEISGDHLCFPDTYCGMDHKWLNRCNRVGVSASPFTEGKRELSRKTEKR